MIPPNPDASTINGLADMGANLARWQLTIPDAATADNMTLKAYQSWINQQIAQMDTMLPLFAQRGIGVVIDLHTPPGGFSDRSAYPTYRMFHTAWGEGCFYTFWKIIANRYKGHPAVFAFDLLNEPCTGNDKYVAKWQSVADKTAHLIAAIDPARRIIVESPYGDPRRFTQLKKIALPRIIYSAHMYAPGIFTHQGLYGRPQGISYPGKIGSAYWDAAAVARWFQPVVDFQKANNARIFIGEFSAVCFAPGDSAKRYLADVIAFMESKGWNWAYHAFREWDGWSVEHVGTSANNLWRAPGTTDRKQLLMDWFKKNSQTRSLLEP